ncbi:enhancer of yellow 2 transcription factor-like protein B-like protein [Backusella circina FSU 941]|nr:enhancer of yellow 2 transcription factor-like protein B-like protein [Backusella circina FSU 941]
MSEEEKIKTQIGRLFVESGEKERILESLKRRLAESGWNDGLDAHTRDLVRSKGLEKAKFEDLCKEANEFGRATVSESIKRDFLDQIVTFLNENLDTANEA